MNGDVFLARLSLKNIHKAFGDTRVIHGVDLDIADGEFTVFVGPSGCGKSTLLRMIAGLETVTDGTVEIGGMDVSLADPSDRGVTMVFQSYALYPHMNVYDNMAFSLKMNGVARDEIDTRVRRAAWKARLQEFCRCGDCQLSDFDCGDRRVTSFRNTITNITIATYRISTCGWSCRPSWRLSFMQTKSFLNWLTLSLCERT